MPFNKINTAFTGAQKTAIQNAINILISELPVKFNLTVAERGELQNISNERYPYAKRSVENHAPTFPVLVSGYAGTTAEATTDFNIYNDFQHFIVQLKKIIEIYEDTQQVAGSELYDWMKELYRASKAAALNQVPGADSVVSDLKTLFDGQGNFGEPVITP